MKKFTTFILTLSLSALCTYASVTFNVNVPAGTVHAYVCGSASALGAWSPAAALPLNKVEGENRFTLTTDAVTAADLANGFKYVCGPDWTYVEKTSSGDEISNRTTAGNPDTVEKWASVPPVSYDNVFDESVEIDGKAFKFQVMVPKNYNVDQSKSYPVLYMAGFKQRYQNSGDDNEWPDNHFSNSSWNIPGYVAELENAGLNTGIIVSFYASLADITPFEYEYFAGTGNGEELREKLIDYVMPAVNEKYRTLTDADNTSIGGGAYGGLFALYVMGSRPDLFGSCIAFSPALWVNIDDITNMFSNQIYDGSRFCLTTLTNDAETQKNDISSLVGLLNAQSATVMTYETSGWHNDTSFGAQFAEPYKWINGNESSLRSAEVADDGIVEANKEFSKLGNASTVYTFMTGSSAAGVTCTSNTTTVGTFYKNGTNAVPASMGIIELPVDGQAQTIYWNLNDGANCSGSKLWSDSDARKLSVKNSRTTITWSRTVVFNDNSISKLDASKDHFKAMVSGKSDVLMSHTATKYELTANVTFADDKNVSIHYGSVNSGSDMGEIATAQVSENCSSATVTFNYLTNQLSVTETSWGSSEPQIEYFQAFPAVTRVGETINVKAKFSDTAGARSFSFRMSYNYGTSSAVSSTLNPDGSYSVTVPNAQNGIYFFDIDYVNASGVSVSSLSYICVKVIDGAKQNYDMVVNAYDGINWSTVGQYKGNFHTHTTQSFDSNYTTAETIDLYHNKDYKILALTDHDYNSFPWELLDQFKQGVPARSPEELGMIAVPGIELSKDDRNNWNERGGGNFNHHNDLFTGRHGQEFQTIEESFAYTQSLGGYIIVNHPGQYWSLDKSYSDTDRDSPMWHANHFKDFSCLIGLEVYNQGNRRPNDRILWDQILTRTMPDRPVWGYSCDDMHNSSHLFRNYQFMLMDEFSKNGLIEAFERGSTVFSYEPGGTGEAKAPRVTDISVDPVAKTITITTDAASNKVEWISGTDIKGGAAANTRKSSIVGRGKTFSYDGFQGSYVRAFMSNGKGETCIQPFGFGISTEVEERAEMPEARASQITLFPNPTTGLVNIYLGDNGAEGDMVSVIDASGRVLDSVKVDAKTVETNITELPQGVYFVKVGGTAARVIKL